MQALIEVHTTAELERVLQLPQEVVDPARVLLGINNRDLQTFEVTLENTATIMGSSAGHEVQARNLTMVGESGIFTPDDVSFVQNSGCQAILVGESLVKQGDPAAAVRTLLS